MILQSRVMLLYSAQALAQVSDFSLCLLLLNFGMLQTAIHIILFSATLGLVLGLDIFLFVPVNHAGIRFLLCSFVHRSFLLRSFQLGSVLLSLASSLVLLFVPSLLLLSALGLLLHSALGFLLLLAPGFLLHLGGFSFLLLRELSFRFHFCICPPTVVFLIHFLLRNMMGATKTNALVLRIIDGVELLQHRLAQDKQFWSDRLWQVHDHEHWLADNVSASLILRLGKLVAP
mmetsp:Transcript_22131/g.39757  ORF Transcript_22131/g.39757 Transcript_22131/m.39757 type:complete len:231 (+) Transcript_22131:463-1155(+)